MGIEVVGQSSDFHSLNSPPKYNALIEKSARPDSDSKSSGDS
jgi:hypothetical protein